MPANKENNQVSGGQSLLEKVFRSVEKRVFEVERVEYSGTVTSFDGQVIESSHFPASIDHYQRELLLVFGIIKT